MPLSPKPAHPDTPGVRRCIVLKKEGFDPDGEAHTRFLREHLGQEDALSIRTGVRYDVEGIAEETFAQALRTVFAEPPVDDLLDADGFARAAAGRTVVAIEPLPGQYDQRADFAAQCLQLLSGDERPDVRAASLIVINGAIDALRLERFKDYLINPTDAREAASDLPATLRESIPEPPPVPEVTLRDLDGADLDALLRAHGLAMTRADLVRVRDHFRAAGREPTETELKILDTYWSDHCRHTTFTTAITRIALDGTDVVRDGQPIEADDRTDPTGRAVQEALLQFLEDRARLHGGRVSTPLSLMDLALFSMREARAKGALPDQEVSGENNAASLVVPVLFEDGRTEDWLFQFKNETHNHPTEIEPVGGAATCLGGAIRDPLSGRAYVFLGLRVSGGGDPREALENTLADKLPQRRLALDAARGFSGYGNQIGVPTQAVIEKYHPGYKAKRLEAGCVGGAVRQADVVRETPLPGDAILLVGGRTGRDGIGGASGSSKAHTETSVALSGAEVQKGNPPEERKLLRFLTDPAVSRTIRRCNDFGAGGVSVAVGELADGVRIDLDAVPLKQEGLTGTEIAVSESQERMAVVVAAADADDFVRRAQAENLEATRIAAVTDDRTLTMTWRGHAICALDRALLDGGWAPRTAAADLRFPRDIGAFFAPKENAALSPRGAWLAAIRNLNAASRRGLQMRFDSTVGANTVLHPYGGARQASPAEAAVSLFPAPGARTAMAMGAGFEPELSQESPFHGALHGVVDAAARLVATGADPRRIRFSLQNYFERPGDEPERWGKPLLAQLGARAAQRELGPAIGGKDSMSGTFLDTATGRRLDVPPTLIAFSVAPLEGDAAVPSHFQEAGSTVLRLRVPIDDAGMPDWTALHRAWAAAHAMMNAGAVRSAHALRTGGIAAAVTEMAAGERIGVDLTLDPSELTRPAYGSLLLETAAGRDLSAFLDGVTHDVLGTTTATARVRLNGEDLLGIENLAEEWERPLDAVYPRAPSAPGDDAPVTRPAVAMPPAARPVSLAPVAHPQAAVLTFPGTNCERETASALERAGARASVPVFANRTPQSIRDSVERFARAIAAAQILVLPGGFSAGDEPDGSGKFIAAVLRSPRVSDAVEKFLEDGGLILGICNGFQGLVKSCLLPHGRIGALDEGGTTLARNEIGHFVSRNALHRVTSIRSPWMSGFAPDELADFPVAHGEGRLIHLPSDAWERGLVPFQYVGQDGEARMRFPDNPNGSPDAAAALTDESGRIFGMMAHPERAREGLSHNLPGERKGDRVFRAGVGYFR